MTMAITLSQNKFAERCGCTQPNVNRAVRQGKLIDEGHGIDPEHPVNAEWMRIRLKRRADQEATVATPTPDPEQTAPPAGVVSVGATHPPHSRGKFDFGANVETANRNRIASGVEARQKEIKTNREAISLQKEKIGYLTLIGKLVRGDEYDRSINRISAVLGDHFRPFAERIADQLEAMAKAGAARVQFFDFVDAEVDKAVQAVQRVCDREIQDRRERAGAAASERGGGEAN